MTDITEEQKKVAIQSAIYYLNTREPFYGSMLQELTIKYTNEVPHAAIEYSSKFQQFQILLNPEFFCNLPKKQRTAVFHHEVLHFTNRHLFRLPFITGTPEEKRIYNISGDMAINQYIDNLPEGCVSHRQWLMQDGSPFPDFQNMERYYMIIKDQINRQTPSVDGPKNKGNVPGMLGSFQEFDQHLWDGFDEETKKQMLEEAKKLINRTMEKTGYTHSTVPDGVKDLLQELDVLSVAINHKQILQKAIKKSVSCVDREPTWKRPNKRYGIYSPGTRTASLPNLSIYSDTSGSISIRELNVFLKITSDFLKVGTRQCYLGLWHTDLYYKKRYRVKQQLERNSVQQGGTDVTCVMHDINKTKPDLALILTDGYFERSLILPKGEVVWIISEQGAKKHPMMDVGKTIHMENLR